MFAFDPNHTLLIKNFIASTNRPPGHGVGLAVVGDIARSYGDEVAAGKSALGEAEITVTIPSQSSA